MGKVTCERCADYIPIGAKDDFCIPACNCPERIDQPRFPSPTSCLASKELDILEARINRANQKLLDLALSGERDSNEIFQSAFDGLVEQIVKVELDLQEHSNSGKNTKIQGRVYLVGFDFVILRTKSDRKIIIPYEKIIKLKLRGRYKTPENEAELDNIKPCFRRHLTFQFGETVVNSPELIQIFFRLRLNAYLLLLINKKLKIQLGNSSVEGKLFDVHKEKLTLGAGKSKTEISISKICSISILEKSKKKATARE